VVLSLFSFFSVLSFSTFSGMNPSVPQRPTRNALHGFERNNFVGISLIISARHFRCHAVVSSLCACHSSAALMAPRPPRRRRPSVMSTPIEFNVIARDGLEDTSAEAGVHLTGRNRRITQPYPLAAYGALMMWLLPYTDQHAARDQQSPERASCTSQIASFIQAAA